MMYDRRKIHFIKKRVQVRFMALFCLLVLLGSVAMGGALYYLIDKRLTETLYQSHIKIRMVGEIVGPVIFNINTIVSLMVIVLAFILAYTVTRRVEKQVLPFMDFAERLGRGDLTLEVPYPNHDLMEDLTIYLNSMIRVLRGRFDLMREHLSSIKNLAEGLEEKIRGNRPLEELKPLYKTLEERIGELGKEVEWFKV